nr:VCBS repeat-containing protein [Hufsiella arboris]
MEKPFRYDTIQPASTTLVSYNQFDKKIYTGDVITNSLCSWDQSLHQTSVVKLNSPAVNSIFEDNGECVVTSIGSLQPSDAFNAEVNRIDLNNKNKKPETLVNQLPRSVQTVKGDFNKDGLKDYVVCGFGNNSGSLIWLEQTRDNKFIKHTIRGVPGAIQAIADDFNGDGWEDIMCLFAQADEGIWLFTNDHHGNFNSKNILRFPPVYGSVSIQLTDFDGDGKQDILYACGDNGDFSRILKPYHGIYIFRNQGNDVYQKAYYYPLYGSTKAVAEDFDKDGDMDIACIAFYADYKSKNSESFLYFEQDRKMHFAPHRLPVNNCGRWLCMDINDLNGDSYPDIILGNFALLSPDGEKTGADQHTPFIILKNTKGK